MILVFSLASIDYSSGCISLLLPDIVKPTDVKLALNFPPIWLPVIGKVDLCHWAGIF